MCMCTQVRCSAVTMSPSPSIVSEAFWLNHQAPEMNLLCSPSPNTLSQLYNILNKSQHCCIIGTSTLLPVLHLDSFLNMEVINSQAHHSQSISLWFMLENLPEVLVKNIDLQVPSGPSESEPLGISIKSLRF